MVDVVKDALLAATNEVPLPRISDCVPVSQRSYTAEERKQAEARMVTHTRTTNR